MQPFPSNSPAATPPVLSANEAAFYLRLSRSSLMRAVRRGDLQPVKLGGRTLFRRADLDALIGITSKAS